MENPIITSIKRSELDEIDVDSGGSADEDENDFTDADAAIDRMLDELQDFQFELEGSADSANAKKTTHEPLKTEVESPKVPKSPQLETVTSSLDRLRFSTIAIEDSPDVDLDALLEDLCCMERDIMSNASDSGVSSNSSSTLTSTSTNLSDATSINGSSKPMSPRSPKSPVPANVSPDVRDRLENLQEETRELTPEEQEERIKKEKIKIALEKMKAASVQKLVVKVFDDNLETSKTMLIDQTWTVRDIVTKMVKKNDVEVDPNWSLIEKLPDMHLERIMEEHENVLPVVFDWTRDTSNMLVFTKRRDKYTLFRNPQNFLLASGTSAGAAQLAEASKDILLEEFFTREHTRLPEVEGILWLREGKKTWQKHYFVLRASGIYYTPKGKTKQSRDLICLVKFEHAHVYLGVGIKKKYRAPTENVFCLKHPKVQTAKSKHVFYLCTEDQKTMHQWVIAMKMAKYGYAMYDNYLLTQQNVEKELMLTSLAKRGTANVKFQDDEEDSPEKPGMSKRRPSASYKEGTQSKSSSLARVKGQGASSLGSLFSNAWKKGVEENSEGVKSPNTPLSGAEDVISPKQTAASSFSVSNRASSISSKSSSGRGSLDTASSKGSLQSSSSRGSLKSGGSFDEHQKALQLEPAPPRHNSKSNENNGKLSAVAQSQPAASFPPPPLPRKNGPGSAPVPPPVPPPMQAQPQATAPPPAPVPAPPPPPKIIPAVKTAETAFPPPPEQDESPMETPNQSLDQSMDDMKDFPSPPPSLIASPSGGSSKSTTPTFDFPPPPPPIPPARISSVSTDQ